jgi:probable phosphoglycerate mutase
MDTVITLVRHGRTPSNVVRALDSAPPGPGLDDTGRAQAAALAERLAGVPLDAVYASRARRAQETAKVLADPHSLPVGILQGSHEIQVGDLEGSTDPEHWEQLQGLLRDWLAGALERSMPGGENGRDVVERFRADIESAVTSVSGGHAVMVTHGGAMRLIARALCPDISPALATGNPIPNTGSIELRRSPSGIWRCVRWADVGRPVAAPHDRV